MTSGENSLPRIAKSLAEKQSITICLPSQLTLDVTAAGLALYLALKGLGKNVSIVSDATVNPEFKLIGQENITKILSSGGDTLVVSIPYNDGGVDNVTYNVEGDRLNILITPEAGHPPFNEDTVTYSYTGGKPDVIITLYAPTLASLGEIYEKNQNQFEGTEIINIDRHFTNADYGTLNYVDKKSPSMTQMINEIMRVMKTEVDKDVASNLYDGLAAATNNFTAHNVNAQTFRMAAYLLDRGATRKPMTGAVNFPGTQGNAPTTPSPMSAPQTQGQEPTSQVKEEPQTTAPVPPTPVPQRPPSPLQQNIPPAQSPVERKTGEAGDKQTPGTAEAKEVKPSSGGPTQLKPQIFQGGSMNKG